MIEGEAPQFTKDDLDLIGKRWLSRIAAAEKREAEWMADAEHAEAIYLCDSDDPLQLNILHSNVETIVPSIYNSTPRPEIKARNGSYEDPISKAVSDVFERAIAAQIDDSRLDTEVEAGAQDAYAAGRSIVRVKFDADVSEAPPIQVYSETGEIVEMPQGPVVSNERIIYENVSWRDYRQGPAKRWRDVPWVCYRHEISDQERERLENPDFALAYDENGEDFDEDQECTLWEIWDKQNLQVLFILADSGKVLDIKEDPLGLSGFFPQPAPVQPITATGKTVPVCPYKVYKHLAKELDTATRRINGIMKGLKVRGAIVGDAQAIEQIAEAGDNELVAVGNLEGLLAAGGLDRAVMWWPVDMAISVLRELYVQREQTKQAIYEVTGISDIVRGQSATGETATAQKIKTEWGSLRIKKMQRGIERQVRDLFVLSAEIIAQHFSIETLVKMTGIQIDQQVAESLQRPLDHYRINVESDSTVRADLTKSRGEMSEFLNGTAQFFGTMAPIVAQAPESAAPLAKMYAAFAGQFNLGKTAEDALTQFVEMAEQAAKQPKDQGPPPEIQLKMQELEMKMKEAGEKLQLELQKLQLQAQGLQLDNQIKREQLGIEQSKLDLAESEAEFGAVAKVAEIEMEQQQERPVRVG